MKTSLAKNVKDYFFFKSLKSDVGFEQRAAYL